MDELLDGAIVEMKELQQPYLGTHHLFLSYLKFNFDKDFCLKIWGRK